jgi:hypothetical protein
VVGSTITQIILGKDGVRRPKEFEIGAVYEQLPENSSFGFDIVTPYMIISGILISTRDNSETSWKRWNNVVS